jgi:hypothetical protein
MPAGQPRSVARNRLAIQVNPRKVKLEAKWVLACPYRAPVPLPGFRARLVTKIYSMLSRIYKQKRQGRNLPLL